MRDPKRIDRILNKLRGYWHAHDPDQRLGQLVSNIANRQCGARDPFYFEDDDLEEFLDEWINSQTGG